MLLIQCPYCDEALPELEFAYAGEAHIARPADPSKLTDEEWRDFPVHPVKPARPARRTLAPYQRRCGRFFNALRDTVSDRFLTTYPAGQPALDATKLEAVE